ncbi:probable serine/threonine-protein kinase At1g54610 [Diospyros lotus]|uniref:probable serine/threonine-protein kinase At1g54610 n=1 Tax=Diospyros lotus TaxID=55363 RepID=UPI00224F58BE|nr:probable serine/threonine-protein kinase At1g54610 [Diospyros lotus]
MGCVQSKGTTTYAPPRHLQKLKPENGHAFNVDVGRPKQPLKHPDKLPGREVTQVHAAAAAAAERDIISLEREMLVSEKKNITAVVKKIVCADDLVDGWPKWLVDHVPRDVLVGLVPKSADSYQKLAKIGQGTYSNVYKARDRDTGKIVALKKVRFDTSEPESVKFMAREIIILRQLDHPNIIKLEGLATSRMQYSLYLVFDYMQLDLARIISRPEGKLTEPQVKCYMQHLLSGLQHCHKRGILHRDIKGSNLLIDKNGMLKIADFGLSNFFHPREKRPLTSRVVTLWYRAPELLLGSTDYGVGIDLWSAGCLLAEMFTGKPIMPGRTEVEQLHRIFKLCGSPSEDYWKRMKAPAAFQPPQQYQPSFLESFKDFPPSSYSLLTALLALEPASRGTAASALQNEFFSSSPLACSLSGLPAISKEEDEPVTSNVLKNKTKKTKQRTQEDHGGHGRKDSITEQAKEDSAPFKDNAETSFQTQESYTSAGSGCSSGKPRTDQESPPPTPTPAFHSNQNRYSKTQAHPNAMKNIKNFPILLASLADTGKHMTIEDNRQPLSRRSYSSVDFRTIDLESISKLFRMPDNY